MHSKSKTANETLIASQHVTSVKSGGEEQSTYEPLQILGQGSFGVVILSRVRETGAKVAVKKVLSDGRLHHRELALLRDHLGPKSRHQSHDTSGEAPVGGEEHKTGSHTVNRTSSNSSSHFGDSTDKNINRNLSNSNVGNCSASSSSKQSKNGSGTRSPKLLVYHPNIVRLFDYFYTHGSNGERNLHIVMDYLPLDVQRLNSMYVRQRQQRMPLLLVKAIIFQLARALTFLHGRGICHRDVKPGNLLVDPDTGVVKLCDFGSAKVMQPLGAQGPREKNVSYICSRYYRAPELLLGSFYYHFQVDMWAVGCVLAELLCGEVLFKGSSTIDQMAEIFKVLGAPSPQEMHALHPQGAEALLYSADAPPNAGGYMQSCHALKAKSLQWQSVLPPGTPPSAVSLVGQLLRYTPGERLTAAEVLEHPFFDELLLDSATLPGGTAIPACVFQCTADEAEALPDWLIARMAAAAKRAGEGKGTPRGRRKSSNA